MLDTSAQETRAVLVVSGLEHTVSPSFHLGPVALTVSAGEGVAVIGTNGAGKSTLIRLVAGLLRPDRGDVYVHGVSARRWGRVSNYLGYVQQAKELPDGVTVETYLKHQLRLRRAESHRYAELVALAALGPYQHQHVRTLSGGNQRKLHIITAVAHRPDLLVLDEPTAGLDPTAQESLLALVGDLKGDGVGILFASHHRDELVALADSLVVLHRGRQITEVSLEAFLRANGRTVLTLEPFDPAALAPLTSWASGLSAVHPGIQAVGDDGTAIQVELSAGDYPHILGQLVAQAHRDGFALRAASYRQPSLADLVRSNTNAGSEEST